MGRAASRESAATTSAWEAAPSQGTPAAVWPAGTSCTVAPAWRSAPLVTTSSGAGDASASPSARLVTLGILGGREHARNLWVSVQLRECF